MTAGKTEVISQEEASVFHFNSFFKDAIYRSVIALCLQVQ